MSISKESVTLTNQGGGMFSLAVGPETYTFPLALVTSLWDGRRDLEHLLIQVLIVLFQAGINPKTATFAAVKSAVEAQTYWWSN